MSEPETIEEYAARMKVFIENRQKFPVDELYEKYVDKWVAWSPDGTAIVASTEDPYQLGDLIRAAGYDPAHCVSSFIE
jgi:hypothetical protein